MAKQTTSKAAGSSSARANARAATYESHAPRGVRVAALLPLRRHWSQQVMRGVSSFVKQNPGWSLRWFPFPPSKLGELRKWKPDGLLAFCESERQARDLSSICRFTVAVKSPINLATTPSVTIDHRAVGRMAADHLLSRGLTNFACLTLKDCGYGEPRMAGFQEFIGEDRRLRCACFRHQSDSAGWSLHLREDKAFCNFLANAAKPIGLFAVDDQLGYAVCEVCRDLGLRVPDDVAVVGADNDESLCQISQPMLSSVRTPLVQVGLEAATMLKSMIARQELIVESRLLEPIQTTVRQSCGVLSSGDPYVAEVLRRIHQNPSQPWTIKQLVKDLPLSRRNLEQRFRSAIGRSPMEEVRRICIERAASMLLNTHEPVWQIAKKCGFANPVHLSVAFHRARGMSPKEFRARFRVDP